LPKSQLKISFLLPEQNSDWAGQALYAWFPDGLLSSNPKKSLTPFSGWPKNGLKNLEELKNRIHMLGGSRIRVQRERARDWVREYKSRFPVQALGRFVVLPLWRRRARLPLGKLPIVLMPGQAFGTGLHDSTRLMLKSIEGTPALSVLDVGAGSGILGLACLRLGAKKVLSLEIEEAACGEMRGNARLNGYKPSQFAVRCGAFPGAMKGRRLGADLVLANIITPVLCALMRALAAQARKGGTLLFSGIHTKAEALQVAAAARAANLKVTGRDSKGDWWCLRALK
jgi:ribosomal protein L11 methyltransferase